VDRWVQSYEEASAAFEQKKTEAAAKAKQVADAAAKTSPRSVLGAAFALIPGAIAGALGGMSARRKVDLFGATRRPAC